MGYNKIDSSTNNPGGRFLGAVVDPSANRFAEGKYTGGEEDFGGGTCGKYDNPLNCRSGRRSFACHSERSSAVLPVIPSEVEGSPI